MTTAAGASRWAIVSSTSSSRWRCPDQTPCHVKHWKSGHKRECARFQEEEEKRKEAGVAGVAGAAGGGGGGGGNSKKKKGKGKKGRPR